LPPFNKKRHCGHLIVHSAFAVYVSIICLKNKNVNTFL
jgi:phage FluMu protein Com